MNVPEIDLPRVVIIGAGFAGLKLAKKLDVSKYQIVVIDKNNYHTFQPLLYQVATSGLEPDSIAYPVRKTLRKKDNVHFRLTEVQQIVQDENKVETSIGSIHYDYLVVATGAGTNFFGMDSIQQNAMSMKSLTESLDLRSKILQNFEQALNVNDLKEQERMMSFVIVGGGPTGVELAGALGELKNKILPKDFPDLDLRKMKIHLIEHAPRVLAAMSEGASKKAHKFLQKLGVHVWLGTRVLSYDGKLIETSGKTNFYSDTLIWAAGVKAEPVDGIVASGKANTIVVDECSRVVGTENVFALGDVSMMKTKEQPNGFPMLGAVAQQQGVQLAKNLNRKARGKEMRSFKYSDKGTMATIGRNLAVADFPRVKLQGMLAWFAWMFVHIMLLVGFRNRMVVFVNWLWNYFRYDNGNRLIVRPFKRKTKKEEPLGDVF